MSDWLQLPDLASARLGGAVLYATDEFFAPKENLLRPEPAVWKEGEYTDRGKWMDGWETRRHRAPDHDWCIVRLGLPGVVRGVEVDTAFFRGNYPEGFSLEGCVAAADAPPDALDGWFELHPRAPLQGDSKNRFPIDCPTAVTHLRLHIYPDGGVARLRVHGEVRPDLAAIARRGEVDLAALENGGTVVDVSDRFFSDPFHLLLPGASTGMHDGWETRRRRGPGHDHVVIRLAGEATVDRVVVDTSYFRGNYPQSCAVDLGDGDHWREVVPRQPLQPHTAHTFVADRGDPATHLRLRIYPDGGVARLRAWGRLTRNGWIALGTSRLWSLPREEAEAELLRVCGSRTFARRMLVTRGDDLFAAAERVQDTLSPEDWLEAFAAHAELGGAATTAWGRQEQARVGQAGEDLRSRLQALNRAYRERFGYTFIVCATGKTAEEILAIGVARLANDPEHELSVAAAEERRITVLRLEKLLVPGGA